MDEIFLNAETKEQGFGFPSTQFLVKYMGEFKRKEREAREGLGGCGENT